MVIGNSSHAKIYGLTHGMTETLRNRINQAPNAKQSKAIVTAQVKQH